MFNSLKHANSCISHPFHRAPNSWALHFIDVCVSVCVGSVRRRATGHVWRFLRPIKFGSRRVLCDVYSFVGPCFRLKLTKKIYNNKCRWWGGGVKDTGCFQLLFQHFLSPCLVFVLLLYIFFFITLLFSPPDNLYTFVFNHRRERTSLLSFFFRVIKK